MGSVLNAASCALFLKLSPLQRGNETISASCAAGCVLSLQHASKGFTFPQDAPKMVCERFTGLLLFIVYSFLDVDRFVLNSYQASRFCDRRETMEQ